MTCTDKIDTVLALPTEALTGIYEADDSAGAFKLMDRRNGVEVTVCQ